MKELTKFKIFVAVVLFFITFILGPMITIWSLNLLFELDIPHSIATYVATGWLFHPVYLSQRPKGTK